MVFLKVVPPLMIYQHPNFHGLSVAGARLHAPQKFERRPFFNSSYWTGKDGVEGSFSGMVSLLNFEKI
jgi:hypothetical protein